MKRANAASMGALTAVLAVLCACPQDSGGGAGGGAGGGGSGSGSGGGSGGVGGDPPGLSPGVVEIYKNSGGTDAKVGCATIEGGFEFWILKHGVSYPVPIAVGETLKFTYVDKTVADANDDGTVTWMELCGSPYAEGLKGAEGQKPKVRRISESVAVVGECP